MGSLGVGLVVLVGAVVLVGGCSFGGSPKPNCPVLAILLPSMLSVIKNPEILSISPLMYYIMSLAR